MLELKGKYGEAIIYTDNVDTTTISQVYDIINNEVSEGSKIRIMPDCLTEDAEILTKDGFKKITDLKKTDKVANYIVGENNLFDGYVLYKKPKNIIIRNKRHDEKIYSFKNDLMGIDMCFSENHRMAMDGNMGVLAKDVENETYIKDYVFTIFGIPNDVDNGYFDLKEDFVRLLCWVGGDGNYHYNQNGTPRVRFGFSKERKIERVKEILNNLGFEYKEYKGKKGVDIYINPKHSRLIINMMPNKIIPRELIFTNHRKIIIEELIKIDGDYNNYINRGYYRLNSKRKEEIDIFQEIMLAEGYYTNMSVTKDGCYYISRVEKEKLKKCRSGLHNKKIIKEEIEYEGKLVCVETDTGYFVARQNGLVFVTGNCHAGKGCVIGTTMTIKDKVVPNLVGVDIGCGVTTCVIPKRFEFTLDELEEVIRRVVPHGFNTHEKPQLKKYIQNKKKDIEDLRCIQFINLDRAYKSIGTLGGGNHFIELGVNGSGDYMLFIHSGSRNLGKQVCDFYQDLAYRNMQSKISNKQELIRELKEQGREKDIQKELAKVKVGKIDKDLAYLEGDDMESYLEDMAIAQDYARVNRLVMVKNILNELNVDVYDTFDTIHNYIDVENRVLRKGSISAYKNEMVSIPLNMRDGIIIGLGEGNEEWNYSAPHGAGRILSRGQAKENITLDEFKESMEGIYTTCVGTSTIDESPMAYKNMDEILKYIGDTVKVIDIIKPIYNFKSN